VNLDAQVVSERIAASIERFGISRFKGVAHRALQDVMAAGALGVEVFISGKVPSQRARTWRFYEGYLKKCGDIALTGVDMAYATAKLKSGVVGIKVKIMPPTTKLPDDIEVISGPFEEVTTEAKPEKSKAPKRPAKKSTRKSEEKIVGGENPSAAGTSTKKERPTTKKVPSSGKLPEKNAESPAEESAKGVDESDKIDSGNNP